MFKARIAIIAALTALHVSAFAADIATPTQLKGGKIIAAQEARALIESKSAVFVDTRSVVNFGKGHVPGAISVAYKEKSEKVPDFDASKDELDLSKLPSDKATKIVFYSDGPTGWKSYKAAVLALQKGYTNVMYMRGGFAEWTEQSLPLER